MRHEHEHGTWGMGHEHAYGMEYGVWCTLSDDLSRGSKVRIPLATPPDELARGSKVRIPLATPPDELARGSKVRIPLATPLDDSCDAFSRMRCRNFCAGAPRELHCSSA